MISWFSGKVPGLASLVFGILLHHDFLVPSVSGYRVPGLVSLSFGNSGPLSFPASFGQGSGRCLPSLLAFCCIIISWFLLVLGRVPGLVWNSVL